MDQIFPEKNSRISKSFQEKILKARKKDPAAKNSYRKIPTAQVLPKKIPEVENPIEKIFFSVENPYKKIPVAKNIHKKI